MRRHDATMTAASRVTAKSRPAEPAVRLLWSPAPERAWECAVVGDGLEFGRAVPYPAPSGAPLDDAFLSARHAILKFCDSTLVLRDLGSRNGVWVGGARVSERSVSPGDVFRLGQSWFEVVADAAAVLDPEPSDAVLETLPGPSTALRKVRDQLRDIAPLVADVMVLGPPGAGKERVARALHAAAGRGPLVSINCAAIPVELAESELFGHARGAFSGAVSARQGAFQRADGGVLFLDEIGELSPVLQPKLLRVLQDGLVRPVGADRDISVRVRVVAATNRDLPRAVASGAFRGDLWSRLARAVVRVPPLAARPADIVWLAERFLGGRALHPDTVEALLLHPWPHGVRDLESVIALLAAQPSPVELTDAARAKMAADWALHVETARPDAGALPITRETAPMPIVETHTETSPTAAYPGSEDERRALLEATLRRHGGNVAHAARALGKRTTSVYRWLRQLGIDPSAFRAGG